MAGKVKTGIIGLGWPGREHLKGYQKCADASVVAVCDANLELARQQAEEYGVARVYTDHREMLAEADIDAVSVCLPNFLHAPVSLDALRAGRHVICEKPPAMNAREARRMADAAAAGGLTLMYALSQRWTAASRLAKDYIDKGELGRIYYARAVYHRRRGIPIGAQSWFVDKKRSGGGALIDIGVHALDTAWWLMGTPRPTSVSGTAYREFKHVVPKGTKFDVDDSAFGLIKFENGATLILECSWALNLPSGGSIQVAGTRGGTQLNPMTIYQERDGIQLDVKPELADGDYFPSQIIHFVECIQKRQEPMMSAGQGVQLMQMLDALYRSSATGREVRIK